MSDETKPAEAPKGRPKPDDAHDCDICEGTGKKSPEVWPQGELDCWACRGRGWFLD